MIELEVADFLTTPSASLVEKLAYQAVRHHRTNERQQLRAWEGTISALKTALSAWPEAAAWRLILEFAMRRLGRRIDALLVTPRAIIVLEFKVGQDTVLTQDRLQVEDYALDLQDFHAGSRGYTIVPILVATEAAAQHAVWPLPLNHVNDVLAAGADRLGAVLRELWARLPRPRQALDVRAGRARHIGQCRASLTRRAICSPAMA